MRRTQWIWIAVLVLGLGAYSKAWGEDQSPGGEGGDPLGGSAVAAAVSAQEEKQISLLQLTDEDLQGICDQLEQKYDWLKGEKKPVTSSLDITLYGKIKWDAAYDNNRVSTGNFIRWVESTEGRGHDDEFNMTGNETRLGMKLSGPDFGEAKTSGLVEIDFFGGGAENKSNPMMRHAFVKLDWPEKKFNILAGQYWDIISPLNPTTLNYAVQWWVGNIQYRRPQIRLTKSMNLAEDVDLKLEGGLFRTIGDAAAFSPGDTGEDAGYPHVQGRASICFPFWDAGKRTSLGVSGHYAEEEFDYNFQGNSEDVESWSMCFDLHMPWNDWISHKAEYYIGENMDAYLGGIGQGITVTTIGPLVNIEEIRSRGGWYAMALGPWDGWRFNLGASADKVSDPDIVAGARSSNFSAWGNVLYSVNKHVTVGLEVSRWRTAYKGQRDGDAFRVQTSFIYKF